MDDLVVRGRRDIAKVLGRSIRTVVRWQHRPSDPLRLWSSDHDPTPWALRSRLVAYRQRRNADPDAPRVQSWATIAAMLGPRVVGRDGDVRQGVSVDHAQRLAVRAKDPLPTERSGRRVWAYTYAVLDWVDAQNRPHVLRGGPTKREDVCPPRPAVKARAKEAA